MHDPFQSDYFSKIAELYAKFRPTYPENLFEWLSKLVSSKKLAWDCGAGSGQASLSLAKHFEKVVATDISATQLESAPKSDHIEYRVTSSDNSGLLDRSVDLITVAQALHWIDLNTFYPEVNRVLHPNGVIAVWCYGIINIENQDQNKVVRSFYTDVIGPYWPAERRHVENGYAELPFPFKNVEVPQTFEMKVRWSLPELLGYIRSWSAVARYADQHGVDPVLELEKAIIPLWGDSLTMQNISWPLSIRVGRI